MLLPKRTSVGFWGAYPPSSHATPHHFWPETHFTAGDVRRWAHAQRIHWSPRIPRDPEGAGLTELRDGLSKTWLWYQLGDSTFGVGAVFSRMFYIGIENALFSP